jgi:hypothetical protein
VLAQSGQSLRRIILVAFGEQRTSSKPRESYSNAAGSSDSVLRAMEINPALGQADAPEPM